MTTNNERKVNLIELSGSNFESWEVRLKAVFYAKDTYDIYTVCTVARPADVAIGADGAHRYTLLTALPAARNAVKHTG